MNSSQLTWFRTFLILWAGAIIAHFTYVQSVTDWGATTPDFNWRNPWDPIYFGVLNASFVAVPFFVFQVSIARRYGGWSSAIGRALLAYGIGTVLWGLGNFYWFLKNVGGDDAPYPSLADAGYLAVLPFAGWALWELSKVVGLTGRDWRWLPLTLAVAFPLNAWIMLPASWLPFGITGPEAGTFDTPLAAVISTTYILSDVVLLAAAIIVAVGARRAAGGRFFAPVLAYTVSILLLYIGDLFFNYRIAKDIFYNGEISDLLYGAFIVASSVAAYLFLAADVRAQQAADDAARAWSPEQALAESDETAQLPPLEALPSAILVAQERVLGPQTARGVLRSVPGISIDEESGTASATDEVAVDALVRQFRAISGPLGEMACWTASRSIVERHPELRIASFDRFRSDSGSGATTTTHARGGTPPTPAAAG
ncbi:MAG: hypothetical protein KDC46_10870 [Thermoleophilia bacterium]|nr:hypothetical protein [Thermoleophilia bacterium]